MKLWCDCKTDEERIELLKNGGALAAGIIAQTLIPDFIEALEAKKELADARAEIECKDALIERMKNCANCDHWQLLNCACSHYQHHDCRGNNFKLWRPRE